MNSRNNAKLLPLQNNPIKSFVLVLFYMDFFFKQNKSKEVSISKVTGHRIKKHQPNTPPTPHNPSHQSPQRL